MHAFLVVSQSEDQTEAKVKSLINEGDAQRLDYVLQKIEDVRQLTKSISLSIIKPTFIVINNFHQTTLPAQNAFLKSLEEPQENLNFVLTAFSLDDILPTIVSRCVIFDLNAPRHVLSSEDKKEIEDFLSLKFGEQLKFISIIKEREKAILFCENLLLFAHDAKNYFLAQKAVIALNHLKRNLNTQLELTNLVLGIASF